MRKLFLFAAIVLFSSCSSDTSPAPEPASPITGSEMHWLPNVVSDTLYGSLLEPTAESGYFDSLFVWKEGDTTGITYHGVKLYAFWAATNQYATYKPTDAVIPSVCFSRTPFNTDNAFSYALSNMINPSKFINEWGDTATQKQMIVFGDKDSLTVKVSGGVYMNKP